MFTRPALREQIITYIGNKRRLLPFIHRGIAAILTEEGYALDDEGLIEGSSAGDSRSEPPRFLDAFAGSGIVSRMARIMGFRVRANDLEAYAPPLIRPFLELAPEDVEGLFLPVARRLGVTSPAGPYAAVLDHLNRLDSPSRQENLYFATHYAPARTEAANPDGERLFYTQENGRKIDAIIETVNSDNFRLSPRIQGSAPNRSSEPADGGGRDDLSKMWDGALARDVLLASLLYEMSVHVNTSGVMKGYHRGWGGRGADALSRIMAPIRLEPLPFISGPSGSVTQGYAETLFDGSLGEETYDIVYADPPYNSHQYGSNYHLLTTAVRNDRYDPGEVVRGSRAGIRRDHNRSAFCRSLRDPNSGLRECEAAFRTFLSRVRAKYLLVSYNTDGLIPPESMARLLSQGGRNRVGATLQGHAKFKGGKNTQAGRRTREVLYRVDLGRGGDREQVDGVVALLEGEERLGRLLDSYIDPRTLPWSRRRENDGALLYYAPGNAPLFELRRDFRLRKVYPAARQERVLAILESAWLEKPELMELYLEEEMVPEALALLRSFKIKKYQAEFHRYVSRLAPMTEGKSRARLEEMIESYGA